MREIQLHDILTCNIPSIGGTQFMTLWFITLMILNKQSNQFICSRRPFKLKLCLINRINKRSHTILSTQLHDIGAPNYYLHKYVEAVKLLLEFKLLYNINFLFKKDRTSLIFIVELLPECKINSQSRNK